MLIKGKLYKFNFTEGDVFGLNQRLHRITIKSGSVGLCLKEPDGIGYALFLLTDNNIVLLFYGNTTKGRVVFKPIC